MRPDKPIDKRWCNYCRKWADATNFRPDKPTICKTKAQVDRAHAVVASKTLNTGRSW